MIPFCVILSVLYPHFSHFSLFLKSAKTIYLISLSFYTHTHTLYTHTHTCTHTHRERERTHARTRTYYALAQRGIKNPVSIYIFSYSWHFFRKSYKYHFHLNILRQVYNVDKDYFDFLSELLWPQNKLVAKEIAPFLFSKLKIWHFISNCIL